ncbi:hypothetical protein ACTA71_011173 [Dictyostelium dimigraforme]
MANHDQQSPTVSSFAIRNWSFAIHLSSNTHYSSLSIDHHSSFTFYHLSAIKFYDVISDHYLSIGINGVPITNHQMPIIKYQSLCINRWQQTSRHNSLMLY